MGATATVTDATIAAMKAPDIATATGVITDVTMTVARVASLSWI
jgi:hypothetical protein